MSNDRFRSAGKSDPSRWSSADPDTVTKLAEHRINIDLAELPDMYWYMRRQYPGVFQGWSIEQFKNWNDERILALATRPAPETTAQARKRMWQANGKMIWNPETRRTERGRWNEITGNSELIPK